ncbi:MAG: hypothetical protein ACXABE_16040, partial [Candidatus Thorarchaeota archaeon]
MLLEIEESTCATCGTSAGPENERSKRYKYGMALLSASTLVLGLAVDILAFDTIWVYAVFIVSMLSAGQFIIPRGVRGLLKLNLDMHLLMSAASIGAMIIGAPAEGAAVMFLFFISMLL